MPDPGEPGGGIVIESPAAAGRVVGAPSGGRVVHLVERPASSHTWHTSCPADIDGVPPGGSRREVTLTLDPIDCGACLDGHAYATALVDMANRTALWRLDREGDMVRRFLTWAHQDPDVDFVPAEYAGDARLHPMPQHVADALVDRWLRSRMT